MRLDKLALTILRPRNEDAGVRGKAISTLLSALLVKLSSCGYCYQHYREQNG